MKTRIIDQQMIMFVMNEMNQLQTKKENLPQIFNGASSSNRIGWDRNISLDFRHRFLISASVSWTFLPGLPPRTNEHTKDQSVNMVSQ